MEKNQTKPNPVVFTTNNTGVSEILDKLVVDVLEQCNLELKEPQYKPTLEEEVEIKAWLEQDKKEKVR